MQRGVAAAPHLSCLPQALLDGIFSLLDLSSLRAVATTRVFTFPPIKILRRYSWAFTSSPKPPPFPMAQDWPHTRYLSDPIMKKLDAAPKLRSIQNAHPSDHWDVQPACVWDASGRRGIAIATLHHGDQALYVVRGRTRSIPMAIIRRPPGQRGTPVISAANRKDGNPFDAAANPI